MNPFSRALLGIGALFALGGVATAAGMVEVEAFGYAPANRPGTFETFRTIGTADVSAATLTELKEIAPSVRSIEIYCAASPGPRFMQIDGTFWTLNGKSRRPGAFVETSQGKRPVRDTAEGGSPLKDDFKIVGLLIDEAASACR